MKQPKGSLCSCVQLTKQLIKSPYGRFGRIYCLFSMIEAQFPCKALFDVHIFVSDKRQMCSLLYPAYHVHHICRMDAEEDVQDLRQLF